MILLFILVPIIPEFLYDINHPDAPIEGPPRITTTTTTTSTLAMNPCPCEQNQNNFSTTAPTTEDCKYYLYIVYIFECIKNRILQLVTYNSPRIL